MIAAADPREERVLLVALTTRDASVSQQILSQVDILCTICADIDVLCSELVHGCAAIILPEERVVPTRARPLVDLLEQQPVWSDLPILVLTRGGSESDAAAYAFQHFGNVLLLERPLRLTTLISATQMALRARRRQYQLRDQMAASQQLFIAEQQARQEAEEAVKLRDSFLSVASHELKTPVTAILGSIQLLERRLNRQRAYTARDERMLQVANGQVRRLLRIIQLLLDTSRIEAGQLTIMREAVDLGLLVQQVADELVLTLDRHTIEIHQEAQPLFLAGDELRLQQVLYNVLGNAIKYSPEGGAVDVTLGQQHGQVFVRVSDLGIGIPEAALPALFDRFYRAANAEGQQIPGLGIGLAVVQEIVTLHGGQITVQSEEGQGTTVTLWFPRLSDGAPTVPPDRSAA